MRSPSEEYGSLETVHLFVRQPQGEEKGNATMPTDLRNNGFFSVREMALKQDRTFGNAGTLHSLL
jgi:hypothetical protein